MAFPEDIGSAVATFDINSGFVGPYKSSGGDFYALVSPDVTSVGMFKSTDPGTAAWSEQDSSNNLTITSGVWCLDSVQDGDTIHVAYASEVAAYRYNTFSMSSDTWGTDESIVDPVDTGFTTDQLSINISRRSDGDLVVLYNGFYENIHGNRHARVYYGVKVSSWTVDTQVSGAFEVDWSGAMIILGSSDRMHLFYANEDASRAHYRTLKSDDVLETEATLDPTPAVFFKHLYGKGMSYDDGGTTKVRAPYLNADLQLSVAEFDSADIPTITLNPQVSDFDCDTSNESVTAFMVADGTDNHLLYVRATDTDEIWRDLNDDTDIEELADAGGGRLRGLSCNVYDHGSSRVLALIYSDDTPTGSTAARYYEFELAELDLAAVRDVLHSIGIIPFAR